MYYLSESGNTPSVNVAVVVGAVTGSLLVVSAAMIVGFYLYKRYRHVGFLMVLFEIYLNLHCYTISKEQNQKQSTEKE